jgi:phosphoribosylformylglycinamidine synthase
MKNFVAIIHIMPHQVLLDPAGKATLQAIHKLGFENVLDTRIGKRIELTVQANDSEQVQEIAQQLANQLLVNPIVETFSIEVLLAENI